MLEEVDEAAGPRLDTERLVLVRIAQVTVHQQAGLGLVEGECRREVAGDETAARAGADSHHQGDEVRLARHFQQPGADAAERVRLLPYRLLPMDKALAFAID